MYWLCNSRRHKSIGGWLLYFYIQIYLAVPLAFGLFVVSTLPHLQANRLHDQTAVALLTLISILPLVMISFEALLATVLLGKREWMMVNVVRGVFFADLLARLMILAIDWKIWPHAVTGALLGSIWPVLWLGYFSYSKRVQKVFKTHDWEAAPMDMGATTRQVSHLASTTPQTGGLFAAPAQNALEVRFFLTPEEFDEGIGTLRAVTFPPGKKITARVANGILALALLYFPHFLGQTWASLFEWRPSLAILLGALFVLNAWNALGQVGVHKLNRLVNRLDWERRIRFSDQGMVVDWGQRNFRYRWQDMQFFQETPGLFVLKAGGTQFWTMPKRAIPAGRGDQLRSMLVSHIPQRETVSSHNLQEHGESSLPLA